MRNRQWQPLPLTPIDSADIPTRTPLVQLLRGLAAHGYTVIRIGNHFAAVRVH